jgi:hypothetical protein
MKIHALQEPSTTLQSRIPSRERAGRIVNLTKLVTKQSVTIDSNLPFTTNERLFNYCPFTDGSPSAKTCSTPLIDITLISKDQLIGLIKLADIICVSCATLGRLFGCFFGQLFAES